MNVLTVSCTSGTLQTKDGVTLLFFYSVDVGHNKMSGAMTIWSCSGFSCQRFSCKHGSFESVDHFQDHIT